MPTTEPAALRPLFDDIRSRLDLASELAARLGHPNLPAARESAGLFRDCFHLLSARTNLNEAIGRAIESEALYRSFDGFLAFRAGEAALTTTFLLDVWSSALAGLRAPDQVEAEIIDFASSLQRELESAFADLDEQLSTVATALIGSPDYMEWLVLFHQAAEQIVAPELAGDQARAVLRGLMTRLELSQDDLGRMFGVSGETVRRWERGLTAIPAARGSEILAAEPALQRLQDLFRPERLPTVLRRPAELFDGESALAWILRGLIVDVADRYEDALLYQA